MNKKHVFLTLASTLILTALFVAIRSAEQSVASEQYPIDTFLALGAEEQERCIEAFGGKASFVTTVEAHQLATAVARPAEVLPTRPRPGRTATPVGSIPPFATRFEPVPNEGQDWRGAESVWIVGNVQNIDGMHFPFYVWTAEVRCRIGTALEVEASDAPFEGVPINKSWDCPSNEGILTITDVTSPTGIVTFENEQGQTGTFNLGTEEWTFEGAPWLALAPAPE